MKQRSLVRDRVPRPSQPFPACVRSKFVKRSYDSKPCRYGKRDALRKTFMDYYKKQKTKDREFGMQLNALWQEFFDENKHLKQQQAQKEFDKKAIEETILYIGQLAKQIKVMSEQDRFSKAFPSFSSFYRFVRLKGVTLQDIKDE